jgi:predicted GIY-YIG superfamily endonuclease
LISSNLKIDVQKFKSLSKRWRLSHKVGCNQRHVPIVTARSCGKVKNRSHNSETNYPHGGHKQQQHTRHHCNDSNMCIIYFLQLEEGKYYVGKTTRSVHVRVKEHDAGNGAAWTRRYSPIRVLDSFNTDDDDAENKEVRRRMEQFGIDNVRGGSYSQIKLSTNQMERLQRDIRPASNQCLRTEICNKTIHRVAAHRNKIGKVRRSGDRMSQVRGARDDQPHNAM